MSTVLCPFGCANEAMCSCECPVCVSGTTSSCDALRTVQRVCWCPYPGSPVLSALGRTLDPLIAPFVFRDRVGSLGCGCAGDEGHFAGTAPNHPAR